MNLIMLNSKIFKAKRLGNTPESQPLDYNLNPLRIGFQTGSKIMFKPLTVLEKP